MTTQAKPRIALWDNARFVLIVLVVVGHTISTIRTDTALGFGLYAYIYLFHMPAMILLSGLFARPTTDQKMVRSTLQLLATWGLWEGIWAVIRFAVEGRTPGNSFLVSPAWTLWFLVTLITMRILLPFFARMKHPLIVSIVIALGAGLLPGLGTEFSAARTLTFLPFFIAGWLIRDRGWVDGEWFTAPSRALRAGAWSLLGVVALGFVFAPGLRATWRIDRWLTWRDDYAWLFSKPPVFPWEPTSWGATALSGTLVTSVLLAVAAAMTFALLIVVPRGHGRITEWGTRTMAVYLLHGPIIYTLRETGAVEWIGASGWPGVLALVALGVAITLVLSAGWVTRLSRPLISPNIDWILAPEPQPARR
ncbi:acyltransferase family protein [Leucobacter chromiireducens]|uniref:acyltransferase family protein n=1 Tax=Leucobacter chromiireducens TaxID=283877 RepID=UPI000F637F30|nr:acyltransferase family protein [Leucobacter chromiireducens]